MPSVSLLLECFYTLCTHSLPRATAIQLYNMTAASGSDSMQQVSDQVQLISDQVFKTNKMDPRVQLLRTLAPEIQARVHYIARIGWDFSMVSDQVPALQRYLRAEPGQPERLRYNAIQPMNPIVEISMTPAEGHIFSCLWLGRLEAIQRPGNLHDHNITAVFDCASLWDVELPDGVTKIARFDLNDVMENWRIDYFVQQIIVLDDLPRA